MSVGKIAITPRGFAKCGVYNAKIIKDAGFDLVYNDTGLAFSKADFYEFTKDATGVVVGVESVDKEYIDSHPLLKAVVKFGVGLDNIDVEYCKQKGIFVGKTVGSNARSVAETAISFIIADSKNLYESIFDVRNHGFPVKSAEQTSFKAGAHAYTLPLILSYFLIKHNTITTVLQGRRKKT